MAKRKIILYVLRVQSKGQLFLVINNNQQKKGTWLKLRYNSMPQPGTEVWFALCKEAMDDLKQFFDQTKTNDKIPDKVEFSNQYSINGCFTFDEKEFFVDLHLPVGEHDAYFISTVLTGIHGGF